MNLGETLETLDLEIKRAERLARRHEGKPVALGYSMQALGFRRLRKTLLRHLADQLEREDTAAPAQPLVGFPVDTLSFSHFTQSALFRLNATRWN